MTWAHLAASTTSSRRADTLFWPPQECMNVMHGSSCRHNTYIHTFKNIFMNYPHISCMWFNDIRDIVLIPPPPLFKTGFHFVALTDFELPVRPDYSWAHQPSGALLFPDYLFNWVTSVLPLSYFGSVSFLLNSFSAISFFFFFFFFVCVFLCVCVEGGREGC